MSLGRRLILTGLLLLSSLAGAHDEPVPPPLLDRLGQVLKQHLRDLTENPLKVEVRITRFDSLGVPAMTLHRSHRFEVLSTRWGDVARARGVLRNVDRGTFEPQALADYAMFFTPVMLSIRPGGYVFTALVLPRARTITISYSSRQTCQTFAPDRKGWQITDWCGQGQLTFAADSMLPLRATFDSAGLPLANGPRTLLSYRVEEEFQSVPLPGTSQPYLLPRRVLATYEDEQGKIIVEAQYSPAGTRE